MPQRAETKSYWDNYRTGIELIDNQHGDLIALHDQMQRELKQGKLDLNSCFERLVAYGSSHFATEESLMRQTQCPYLPIHKHAHDEFLAFLDRHIHQDKGRDTTIFARSLLSTVRSWIENHMLAHDKRYAEFVLSRYTLTELQTFINRV